MTDEYVLSQADIDAMVAKGSGGSAPADPAAIEPPVKVQKVTEGLAGIKSIPARRDVASVPAAAVTIAPAAAAPSRPLSPPETKTKQASPSEVEALRNTVAELTSRLNKLESVMLKSQKSFRCDVRNNFNCGKCHSQGKVAMYLKCTSCGEEQWVGWWPHR
jgi:hypothetical protein